MRANLNFYISNAIEDRSLICMKAQAAKFEFFSDLHLWLIGTLNVLIMLVILVNSQVQHTIL